MPKSPINDLPVLPGVGKSLPSGVAISPRPKSGKSIASALLAIAGLIMSCLPLVGFAAPEQGAIRLDKHRQLFVDNHLVAEMQGVKRVLNQPVKHPANPVLRPDRPWEGIAPFLGTVLYDEATKLFRIGL